MIAFGIAFVVEMYRRPKLILSWVPPVDTIFGRTSPTGDQNQKMGKSLRIAVYNKPFLGYRTAALQCKAEITFYQLDGRNRFGKSMAGKWTESPQPGPI